MTKPNKKTKTNHEGVYETGEGRWWLKATIQEPKTGKRIAREKMVELATIEEAVAAREVLLEGLRAEVNGGPVTTQPKPTTVAVYAERWLAGKAARLRPGVVDHYVDVLGTKVLPVIGEVAVVDLTRADVDAWVAWAEKQRSRRGQAYARDTLSGWWRVLCNFLRDAAADYEIADPTRRIKPPQSTVRRVSEHRALSAEQLGLLLATVKRLFPTWYAEVYVIAFTGMRPSELYGLKTEDVDIEGGVIHVRRSVDARHQVENPPKTGIDREPALSLELKAVLHEHRQRLLREQHPGLKSGLLFPNEEGGFRGAPALLNLLHLAGKAAKIPVTIGPKTLRKTFITLAALAGHDRLAIRANVGHCDEDMTERYAWVSADEKRGVVEAIEQLAAKTRKG